MIIHWKSFTVLCFSLGFIALAFQNCSSSHGEGSTTLSSVDLSSHPRSIEIFQSALYPQLQQNCSECHHSAHAYPFADNDVANAHRAIFDNNLISIESPETSRLVNKIAGGHNSKPVDLADDFAVEISSWSASLIEEGIYQQEDITDELTYNSIYESFLAPKCLSCHGPSDPAGDIRYDSYIETLWTINFVFDHDESLLYQVLVNPSSHDPQLESTSEERARILQWIEAGAPEE